MPVYMQGGTTGIAGHDESSRVGAARSSHFKLALKSTQLTYFALSTFVVMNNDEGIICKLFSCSQHPSGP